MIGNLMKKRRELDALESYVSEPSFFKYIVEQANHYLTNYLTNGSNVSRNV
jgi:hypothetical protein